MEQQDKDTIRKSLVNIADMLIINGTLLECPGLWYGRMGVAIFFFHYAHYTKNELFEEYAIEIIEQIQKTIHQESSIDYARGLAGIGVGIEYLAQNDYLDINTNEVLEDFDLKITHNLLYKQHNNSLHDGIAGIGKYLFFRLANPQILRNEKNMLAITQIVERIKEVAITTDSYLPDIILLLNSLNALNICNSNINYCVNKIQKSFSSIFISTVHQPEMAFALMQMAVYYKFMEEIAYKYTQNILNIIRETGIINNGEIYDTLLWLMRCKRFIKLTKVNTYLNSQIEILIQKHIKQLTDISFEKGKLSLRGCAGIGLMFISVLTERDDVWLDLY